MSTLTILVGFALMLFLPCAVAMMGSRDTDETSAYADRLVDPLVQSRVEERLILTTAVSPHSEDQGVSAFPSTTTPNAHVSPKFPTSEFEVTDPILPNRTQKTHQARILRNEIEALMAAAAAARAQADALAANARLADAKAEAADAQALAAEEAAAVAIQEMRRAA
jgi:hypothetical protein